MRRPFILAAIAGLVATLAVAAAPTAQPTADARVVVAPIDSGINPYHQLFRVDDPAVTPEILTEFGIDDEHILRISEDYRDDVKAGIYDDVVEGELYWFAGTNIMAYSTGFGDRPFLPDTPSDTHGTGVTGAVVNANPDAIILFVEGISDAGEEYAFTHPGVDIITTSYGFATSAPLGALNSSYTGVVEQGKLHFGAAANDPTLAPTDGTAGPWWVIGIAGYGEDEDPETDGGKETLSGTAPDFVADFTQDLPYCDRCNDDRTQSVSGTSFATPRSAGTMSRILLEARRQAGHTGGISPDGFMVDTPSAQLSNWHFRRALEEGAYMPQFTTDVGATEQPVNDQAPYVHVGWGVITPESERAVVSRTLSVLFDGEGPFKDQPTCDYMTRYMEARYAMWDVNPLSDSFGQTNTLGGSPYITC